jgi:1-acyl-sn-glycerol-3-phosphate acyltransferase
MLRRLGLYLFNAYFYTVFLLSGATLIPLFTLYVAATRPFTSHRAAMRRFRRAMVWWGRVVALIPWPFIKLKYELRGTNDVTRPFIFICNHRSAVDAFLMGVLPHEFVEIVNDWPFRIPVLGFFARYAAFLNVRSMTTEEFGRRASTLLAEGVSIIFFPEGTRSAGRKMGSFHGTAFRLALDTGVPIVPLCISGNETVMPKGSSLLYPGTIRVRQLEPLTVAEYGGLTPFALKNRVRETIQEELVSMERGI